MFEPNISVVIDSQIKSFVFKLENEEIKYDIFDSFLNPISSSKINDKGIKIYSVFIDLEDVIHLVALMNTGELNYYKYIDEKWLKGKIASFDLKSNRYNQIKIFIVRNKLHLIYNYSNFINSNIWTFQHVIYDNANGGKHNIIRYLSKQTPDPFFVDVDSFGGVHLFYKTDLSGISQVYHAFYNSYTNIWSPVPKQISKDNINNLETYLFIDSSDNLHGLLLEEEKDRYKLKYLRMSSSGKEKYIWKEIALPYISSSNYPPIIFEEDKSLKLLYISNNKIKYLLSKNYGITWTIENTIDHLDDYISLINLTCNLSSKNHKINHIFFSSPVITRFNFLNIYPSNSGLLKEINDELPVQNTTQEIVEEVVEEETKVEVDILSEINDKIDQIFDNHNMSESLISMIVSKQLNMENRLNNIQSSLDENKKNFFYRIFNSSK